MATRKTVARDMVMVSGAPVAVLDFNEAVVQDLTSGGVTHPLIGQLENADTDDDMHFDLKCDRVVSPIWLR